MSKCLFVCGCPRSGTTALVRVLNSDKRFAIGLERYYKRCVDRFNLTPEFFKRERFFSLEQGDTFWPDLSSVDDLRERFDGVAYKGDKVPRLYERLDSLFEHFKDVTVLMMFRNVIDVAASYNVRARNEQDKQWDSLQDYSVAVSDWNSSLSSYLDARDRGFKVVPVIYEEFFSGGKWLGWLYDRLELTVEKDEQERFDSFLKKSEPIVGNLKKDVLSAREKKYILENSRVDLYKKVLADISPN